MISFFRRLSRISAKFILVLICLLAFGLMFWASRTDSAIDDELAHIPAGYGYVHNLDYRLNPEHPPLVKALAMLPVLLLHPNFPTNSDAWQNQINAEWSVGTQFLYQSGNDANAIIQTARIMPILLTILTILLTYALARKLLGNLWALLPAFLFGLSPTVLAQGHYVTTDVGATFGILLSTYYFLRYVGTPSRKNLFYAGIAFGVAQLTKFSTPLLIPLFLFLAIVLWFREGAEKWFSTSQFFKSFFTTAPRYLWRVVLIFIIGYILIVYPVYFLFTAHYPIQKQTSDTIFTLNSFSTGPTPAGQFCKGIRCAADLDIWMSKSYVFRPYAEYLLGILMALQRVDGGNTIYFLGRVVGTGGWIYFPVLYLLKETIPTLIIVFLALILALWWIAKRAVVARGRIIRPIVNYLHSSFAEFSLASFVILYWGYSMHSPLNLGIRHILPTIPFIYILAAVVWKKWITRMNFSMAAHGGMSMETMVASMATFTRSIFTSTMKYIFLVVLLIWFLFEAISAAPYFLSYFNEFGGGVWNGYHYVTDSNYDWGQDLLRLQTWMNANPQVDKIAVDYFGGGDPHYYLGDKEIDWGPSMGDPRAQGIHWIAISINNLEGDIQPLAPGQKRDPADTYSWLTALRPPAPGMGNVPQPDYRVGTSIFIYHLP